MSSTSNKFPDLCSTTRSFISPASFHIFNRLCDSLILLALVYSHYYPTHPFCPWLLGTDFVEHFFGLARQLLPNFTYAELIKMVQHIMYRQQIMLTGKFTPKKSERTSRVGYIMDFESKTTPLESIPCSSLTSGDVDALLDVAYNEVKSICKDILSLRFNENLPILLSCVGNNPKNSTAPAGSRAESQDDSEYESDVEDEDTGSDNDTEAEKGTRAQRQDSEPGAMAAFTAEAACDTARLAALSEDHEIAIGTLPAHATEFLPLPTSSQASVQNVSEAPTHALPGNLFRPFSSLPPSQNHKSAIIGDDGKVSYHLMLESRRQFQSGFLTKSERVAHLDPKFFPNAESAGKETRYTSDERVPMKEAAHRVCIAQDLNASLKKDQQRKTCELRWKAVAKDITQLIPMNGK